MKKRFTKNDGIFLLIVGVCCMFLLLWYFFIRGGSGDFVTVTVGKEPYGTYSLNQEQTIEIRSENGGTNILRIADGKADMVEADCPDKICVYHKAISRRQETIVCLPNQVAVTVESGSDSDLDAISVTIHGLTAHLLNGCLRT